MPVKLYHTRSSSLSATNRATWTSSPRSACTGRRSVACSRRASIRSGPPRGCHCRWLGWIGKCEKCGITRLMSKKGCSSDNSVCEGFFGS